MKLLLLATAIASLALATMTERGNSATLHLRLTSSEPAKDSVLATAPSDIKLWFSQKPLLRISRVTLTGPSGVVATGDIVQDAEMLRAPITGAMTPGAYTVSWLTASSDGHPIRGTFGFRVGATE